MDTLTKNLGRIRPRTSRTAIPATTSNCLPQQDPPTHALVRQPEEVSLENENENENENANGHAAIQEGVVVVLLHHHHHHRRHSTLFIFRHSAPTRRSPLSSLSPVQVGVFGSSSSSSPMVYSKDSCIALMLSPVRVRSFTGFSRVVPIMITACGNSDFPEIQKYPNQNKTPHWGARRAGGVARPWILAQAGSQRAVRVLGIS